MDPPTSQPPPIPRQSRHQSRHKALQNHRDRDQASLNASYTPYPRPLAAATAGSEPHRPGTAVPIPPASPEVISSLITSLSAISKPASNHFEGPVPSPRAGSFGVDYGAYSNPSHDEGPAGVSLDEIAASPPVIRTSKPPSGFSSLTAPKSPGPRESTSFKSMLLSGSRPSSKGSLGSRDDTSIGNLSIERGAAQPELRTQRSHDSWGKKQSRGSKGLMYMSSKERLREKELEKKRASIGAVGGNPAVLGPAGSTRADPFLAETPITEEQSVTDSPPLESGMERPNGGSMDLPSPRPIPTRDSSLRKTGSGAKRSSARHSRTKRDSDAPSDTIPEHHDENPRSRDSIPKPRALQTMSVEIANLNYLPPATSTTATNITTTTTTIEIPQPPPKGPAARPYRSPSNSRRVGDMNIHAQSADDIEGDDFAPFPSVAQNRRRDASYDRGRRRSGQYPDSGSDNVKHKRSSSKMKRASGGTLPPLPDDRAAGIHANNNRSRLSSPEPPGGSTVVAQGYERPPSADSVDDAVESYLCSPRLSQRIKHPQTGRVISFSEVGDPEGSAVFCCVGMGLTRYITAFYDELALTLKLRLITPDRPGVGDSEAYADGTATPLSWPDDVYAICQALKINKFSILAHSAGAIYALATALRMPQHIRGRIHLLAPWIPPSQMNVFGTSQNLPPTNAIPTSQRILRALPTPILKAANSSFMTATSSSITSSLPKTQKRGKRRSNANANKDAPTLAPGVPSHDKENYGLGAAAAGRKGDTDLPIMGASPPTATENMDRVRPSTSNAHLQGGGGGPGGARLNAADRTVLAAAASAVADKERQTTYDTRLTHAIWELATTNANPAVDLLVCLERRHTIGFRYVDITRPVVIHHGSKDTRVPVENVRWLGRAMRRCEVRVLEEEGHGLMASAGVMGGVLMEISKEWEDWIKATGTGGRARSGERGRRGTIGR